MVDLSAEMFSFSVVKKGCVKIKMENKITFYVIFLWQTLAFP